MAIPATSWTPVPQNTEGDFSSISAEAIVDESGVALVDESGVAVVSPTSTFTGIDDTVWAVNDSNE